jgi:hypothetical protein
MRVFLGCPPADWRRVRRQRPPSLNFLSRMFILSVLAPFLGTAQPQQLLNKIHFF